MKNTLINIGIALLKVYYFLCRMLPKKNRIVCLSRQNDTPPVDFIMIRDYVSKIYPKYDVAILAKTLKGIPSYCTHVLKQTYYLATSKAVLLDSYCIPVSLLGRTVKAPVIQMWHAMGNMKRFGYTALDEEEGRSKETAQLLHMHEGYDSVLISSLAFSKDFAAGFNIDESILYESPLPKTDLLIDKEVRAEHQNRIYELMPETRRRKNIVYCPTFRKQAAPNEHQAMQDLLDAIDFSKYNLIFKKHPVSTQSFDDDRVIQNYPKNIDPLYVADYVISDYSTVIYEAGLLDVPVFLYAYDWPTYSQKRSLNIDIEQDVPTLFTDDAKRILRAIENDEFDHASYREFMARNIALPEKGSCTQRVVEHTFDLIETHS